jgi:TolB-like protein
MLSAIAIAVVAGSFLLAAAEPDPVLVRVSTRSAKSHVGTLVSEDGEQITLKALQNGQEISIARSETLQIVKPLSLDDAARVEGLATVAGWRISQMATRETPLGKVAQVTPQVVYVTLGEKAGARVGRKLTVFRNKGEIKDPDTGVVLAVERPRIAELEVVEVNPAFSKAKIIGDLEVTLQVGDEVEPDEQKMRVAVCPLLNEDGTLTNLGAGIAEDLTTTLVQRKITVVERAVMDMVLGELLLQNTILFDPKSAQNLGKLTGANYVLTGKIVPNRNVGKAYVRLINVQTGEIAFAVASSLSLTGARVITPAQMSEQRGSGGTITSDSTRSTEARRRGLTGGAQSGQLGASRALPAFLTTDGRYARTEDRGIRLQGFDARTVDGIQTVTTRKSDYLTKDFTFEVLLTFGPGDRIAYIGLGPGKPDRSYNGLTDSIYLRFHAPDLAEGLVDVTGFRKGHDNMGKVNHGGTHMVRIIKEGDSVTFTVDPENDGPSDDDLELTIPNIREYAPFFNSKNMPLFFGGSGTYLEASVID